MLVIDKLLSHFPLLSLIFLLLPLPPHRRAYGSVCSLSDNNNQKNLTEAATLMGGTLDRAKTVAPKVDEVGNAVKPVAVTGATDREAWACQRCR